jgi:NAD+ synthase (glutamine-hydrolysing)
MNHGFIKVAAAIPSVKVADCKSNTASILGLIKQAVKEEVQLICFPELAITAYIHVPIYFTISYLLMKPKIA